MLSNSATLPARCLEAEARRSRGVGVIIGKPADPEAKGPLERAHHHLEWSDLPGRQLSGPVNVNRTGWRVAPDGGLRARMQLFRCSPADRIGVDEAAMPTLPPVAPAAADGVRRQSGVVTDRERQQVRLRHHGPDAVGCLTP
jgi:hypothetical protein